MKLGFATDEDVTMALSQQYGLPAADLSELDVDPNALKLIPMETALRHLVLPLSRFGATLTIAMADPTNVFALDDLKFITGFNVEPMVATESAILDAIKRSYGTSEEEERKKEIEDIVSFIDEESTSSVELEAEDEGTLNLAELEKAAEEAPVIRLVNYIL
ncbi:MAG TPA: hypothetical protein VN203_19045, partial [Candidatus Acidoferrum sp.]|nr:hypothetical protein [Candidatus Acidoferrum sp.]